MDGVRKRPGFKITFVMTLSFTRTSPIKGKDLVNSGYHWSGQSQSATNEPLRTISAGLMCRGSKRNQALGLIRIR